MSQVPKNEFLKRNPNGFFFIVRLTARVSTSLKTWIYERHILFKKNDNEAERKTMKRRVWTH